MPIHNNRGRCLNTVFACNMDVGSSLKWITASTIAYWYDLDKSITQDLIQIFKMWGNYCGGNDVRVHPYTLPAQFKVIKHLMYVQDVCGIQSEVVYSLNH
jgi:hypothetical protein